MKKVKISVSTAQVNISSSDIGIVIQILTFMGHAMFNRILEEYRNFCTNKSLVFQFSVGDFFICFDDIT